MIKILIMGLLLSIIVASCEEDIPHNVAEGVIIHSGTKKPLEGVKIYMYDGVGHSSGWVDIGGSDANGNNCDDSTVTDANGFFHIELDAEKPVLYPFKKGYSFEYVMGGAVIGIVPLITGVNKNLKLEMDAPAYFDPIFINTYKLASDTLKFLDYAITSYNLTYGIGASGYYEHIGIEPFRPYKNYPMLDKGDHYHLYIIEITRLGKKQTIIDSAYIPSFTTYIDTIYY
jgi:hypothetical protein